MSHHEWREKYGRMRDIADRIRWYRHARAKLYCRQAGLDDSLLGIHPHNAMVSFNAGHPWQGVNYSLVRRCLRELDRQFDGYRIVERWDRRVRGIK